MELFRGVNIDWLGKKWYFLAFSLIFSVAGVFSLLFWHHLPLDVDFHGGTLVRVKFDHQPDADRIRQAVDRAGIHDARITTYGPAQNNEVIIALAQRDTHETSLDAGRAAIVNALKANYPQNNPEVRSVEIVGPQVGSALRNQALLATGYSLAGMLVYLWFRFELIYGVAAVVAVFHDTLITVGFFSLFNMEISLTVIAAILTLIGYSMNDTIVVFDRIRENLAVSRRESLADVVNRSINQTLSRTVLTSGLTFLTVLSLFFLGGEVLHPFSFALVVGILIGTYSSIAVAAPMLVAYQQWRTSKGKGRVAALPAAKRSRA
ncbi:Protein-export membrane protein SecF [Acidisarcina polymorpha]|uniref:Protein-export membrane protein SecF n=1 Tax=Acidisarcina polymorpha TaxID=2211140 RepID=A0A2Z5FXK8_9BACT|nr:protein translocase subunit SecF [Acidisarcina polymorpha]AXC11629.1 Protein-export membrane protein SecF [Acidisarcina polymorpha]